MKTTDVIHLVTLVLYSSHLKMETRVVRNDSSSPPLGYCALESASIHDSRSAVAMFLVSTKRSIIGVVYSGC